jgi:predicted nucleic acid-binding protein
VNGIFVVDSSVAIAWAVPSQGTAETLGLLQGLGDSPVVVPVLWGFEIANALLALLRRRVIRDDQYERACQSLVGLDSVTDEEGPRLALNEISKLAKAHSLSVYDAVYLELAIRRGLPLASRDGALNKAAKNVGVTTLL